MRKLVALALTFFLVFQTTAATAAPVEPCCLDGCTAATCAVMVCQACTSAVATQTHQLPVVPKPSAGPVVTAEAAFCSATYAIWRPPD